MTQRLFIKWVDFEFPFVRPNKILLVFDSARSHLAETVKEHLHRRGILFAVIPGGLTSLLQPCDVVWFKPLKTHLERSIDEWKSGGGHSLTRSGRPRPPTIDDMANWLASGWAAMNEQMLARSFDRCFLGDILFLHIAIHSLYGTLFRSRIAVLTGDGESGQIDDAIEESDNEIIDEE